MKYEEILKELGAGKFRPVYLLMGEEPYYIDQVSDYIENNALPESERAFNQTVVYGKDISVVDVIHAAMQYPMMSARQVVIVKEAQNLDKLGELEKYVASPLETTVLVICHKYKSVDKRLKLVRMVEASGAVLDTKKLYDNQVPEWVRRHAASVGVEVDDKAAILLSDFIGTDLSAIASAIEKLKVAMGTDRHRVTAEDVERNIGISKEFNNFELLDAVVNRNVQKANMIVKAFGQNPKANPIQVTISAMFGFFQKLFAIYYLPDKSEGAIASSLRLNPFIVRKNYLPALRSYTGRKVMQIISILREYDLKSKGFGAPAMEQEDMLREMIFKIMH